jgi:hypothetical protein
MDQEERRAHSDGDAEQTMAEAISLGERHGSVAGKRNTSR